MRAYRCRLGPSEFHNWRAGLTWSAAKVVTAVALDAFIEKLLIRHDDEIPRRLFQYDTAFYHLPRHFASPIFLIDSAHYYRARRIV